MDVNADKQFIIHHMNEEKDKEIVRRMKNTKQLSRIANAIRGIEHMQIQVGFVYISHISKGKRYPIAKVNL